MKLTGIRVESTVDATQASGEDRVVVQDASAPPLWARFYELGTNRPIFSSRCEVPECATDPLFMRRYALAEIENERRVGYAWYGNWPAAAIAEYTAWKSQIPVSGPRARSLLHVAGERPSHRSHQAKAGAELLAVVGFDDQKAHHRARPRRLFLA